MWSLFKRAWRRFMTHYAAVLPLAGVGALIQIGSEWLGPRWPFTGIALVLIIQAPITVIGMSAVGWRVWENEQPSMKTLLGAVRPPKRLALACAIGALREMFFPLIIITIPFIRIGLLGIASGQGTGVLIGAAALSLAGVVLWLGLRLWTLPYALILDPDAGFRGMLVTGWNSSKGSGGRFVRLWLMGVGPRLVMLVMIVFFIGLEPAAPWQQWALRGVGLLDSVFLAPFFFVACAGLAEQLMGKRVRHEASM